MTVGIVFRDQVFSDKYIDMKDVDSLLQSLREAVGEFDTNLNTAMLETNCGCLVFVKDIHHFYNVKVKTDG